MRSLWILLTPPLSVCRYGCNSCCIAPISVFWLAGLMALGYGYLGGPANLVTISWTTISLGLVLWCISSIWAAITIFAINNNKSAPECRGQSSRVCKILIPEQDDSNPFDEVSKFNDIK